MAAHALIVDELGALDPRLPVLSEESGVVPFAERQGWPAYWLVDPLDGTREFLRRTASSPSTSRWCRTTARCSA